MQYSSSITPTRKDVYIDRQIRDKNGSDKLYLKSFKHIDPYHIYDTNSYKIYTKYGYVFKKKMDSFKTVCFENYRYERLAEIKIGREIKEGYHIKIK